MLRSLFLCISALISFGAQAQSRADVASDVQDISTLNRGFNYETEWHVEPNEISLNHRGIDAFFAESGLINSYDHSPLHGVGLLIDGRGVEKLRYRFQTPSGKWSQSLPVEVTWSEGFSHVARIILSEPALYVRLERNGAELAFMQIEPMTEKLAPRALARTLDLEKASTSKTPLAPGVISRASWGARSTGACGDAHSPKFLTIHHTSTPNNDTISAAARMRQMQAFHIDVRGWCDFAYHYTVGIDGKVYEGRDPARTGAHVGDWNTNNVGISVVGTFIGFNPRESQLNALTSISKWIVDRYGITKNRTQIRGHKEWPGHTSNDCPGTLLPWLPTLVRNLSGGSTPAPVGPGVLDSFESSLGRFDSAPTASGSTSGVASTSSIARNNSRVKNGSWSLQVGLKDDTTTNESWSVRLLSGGGNPNENTKLKKAGGRIGFWVYTAAPGVSVALGVDDSDGIERTTARTLSTNTWTFVEWKLDDQAMWEGFSGGNGLINSAEVTLDSLFINRAQNANDVFIYIDDVSYRVQ
jgi:hypothetical protein